MFFSYFYEDEHGLHPETEFIYDLELPRSFEPKNVDEEVSDFYLLPIKEVSGGVQYMILSWHNTQWAKSPKNSLKECVFFHIVKNTLLHNAFSTIFPTGHVRTTLLQRCFLFVLTAKHRENIVVLTSFISV